MLCITRVIDQTYSWTVDGDVLVNNAGDFDFEDMMTFGE